MTRLLARYLRFLIILVISASGCGVAIRGVNRGAHTFKNSTLFHQGRHGPLTDLEKSWAQIAWQYFENNYYKKTGLVNSMDRYPSTSMWQIGDYLIALVIAKDLELITEKNFDERLSHLLGFLNTMELFDKKLPNRLYHTKTGQMINYNNQPGEIGWSAVDIGRLLIGLRLVRDRYSEFSEYIEKAILRWDFTDILDQEGSIYGGIRFQNQIKTIQEGRLGYEEYCALGFQLWGFNTQKASRLSPYKKADIYGIEILQDSRDPRTTGIYAPVVSQPYLLYGVEFNWDTLTAPDVLDSLHSARKMARLANNIYKVQEARYNIERIFTARTDHPMSQPPYFVHDSIFADGQPWNTIADDGKHHPKAAMVSTRAAFGLWALWKTAYTNGLIDVVRRLYDSEKGFYEGREEISGLHDDSISCSTNAFILECIYYKKHGKIWRYKNKKSYYRSLLSDHFRHPQKGFPPSKN